jgi:hypothetical protein
MLHVKRSKFVRQGTSKDKVFRRPADEHGDHVIGRSGGGPSSPSKR